jgi:hypothetical protein
MAQEVFTLNCPHCGELIEVVCPLPDRRVSQVKAEKTWRFHGASATSQPACRCCHEGFCAFWYTS